MTSAWVNRAISAIERDFNRSADTHLIQVPCLQLPNISIYLKDESIHPSGSLKHRLARSLFLYGICNGWIREGTPIVEASSGSTAISEAYFAQLLDLPFHTVIPANTSREKVKKIEFLGGTCHLVDGGDIYSHAERIAKELKGHYMDQFTFAERATDWRANNNIAESMFRQMALEADPVPKWVVVSAGTGGTSATIGRYIRYQKLSTQLCVADPENSVYYDYYQTGDRNVTSCGPSRIEGIGRPRVEASFLPTVVDRMIKVDDAASLAAIRLLECLLDRKCGGSTGTNFWATMQIVAQMIEQGETGSVVTLICDGGERYLTTYYDDAWIASQGLDPAPYEAWLRSFLDTGKPPACL
ncbi:PLP-dependent cysteine synthase family protein [Blastopirellula sp. JC732]|uniref:L-cysteine desulfhydrase Cds1 n=1 Tax=Blastopirellula sediminis TaxID=2894196 RepID=A0A9X1MJZ7_9BACT|nr:PLP-dependent cysteine synthase family protein [Blastopirellula sediminis]MCC9609624.1 PLP-dependent cysteine synthase family protein [Blastopirellula sediminis]MCC9627600.1 PLP-dependent cysteine synthase family protein [Blastopirellula sediminis]